MYLEDFLNKVDDPYHKGEPSYYIKFENESQFKEVDYLTLYSKCILAETPNYIVSTTDFKLRCYYTFKVKSYYTLKEYLDRLEMPIMWHNRTSRNIHIICKGDKNIYELNEVTFFRWKDRIVRRTKFELEGTDTALYIWLR